MTSKHFCKAYLHVTILLLFFLVAQIKTSSSTIKYNTMPYHFWYRENSRTCWSRIQQCRVLCRIVIRKRARGTYKRYAMFLWITRTTPTWKVCWRLSMRNWRILCTSTIRDRRQVLKIVALKRCFYIQDCRVMCWFR